MPQKGPKEEHKEKKGENKNTEQPKFEGQYQMSCHMCNLYTKRKREQRVRNIWRNIRFVAAIPLNQTYTMRNVFLEYRQSLF